MTQQEFFTRYTYNVRTDKIGGGSFGTVYKAEDNVLHRKVAIKVSEVKVINGKEFSLKDEFEAIKSLPHHPNIANYEELHTYEGPQGVFDYAVMQFYEDGNLNDAIKQSLSFEQKEQIATDLLQGIIHLHKHNVVHRDLKPGNILVVNRGNKIIPVITDFGLSKQVFQDGQSRFSNSFGGGTLKYSSPEQLRGEELRLNTDLWSYGVIVHQIFTGKDLFYAKTQSSGSADAEEEIFRQIKNKDISADLAQLPAKWEKVAWLCLERNPAIRVKSAEELLSILSGSASTPTPPKQPKTDEETKVFNKQQSGQNHSNDPIKIEGTKPEKQPDPPQKDTPPPEPKKNKILIPAIIIGVVLAVVLFVWQPWNSKPETPNSQPETSQPETSNSQPETSKPSAKPVELPAERKAWQEASNANTLEAYERYLTEYPNGKYNEEATKRIYELKDEDAWEKAKVANTIASYEAYRKSFKDGEYYEEARIKIDELDNKLFKEAKKKNTREAYEKYLKIVPFGLHAKEAKEAIETLNKMSKKIESSDIPDMPNMPDPGE